MCATLGLKFSDLSENDPRPHRKCVQNALYGCVCAILLMFMKYIYIRF